MSTPIDQTSTKPIEPKEYKTIWQIIESMDDNKRTDFISWFREKFWSQNLDIIRTTTFEGTQSELDDLKASLENKNFEELAEIQNIIWVFKDIFERWEIKPLILKNYLEIVKNINTEKQAFMLSAVITKLNKHWISIDWLKSDGSIKLRAPKWMWAPDISPNDMVAYTNHLNNFLAGNNNKEIFFQALLYKTSLLEDFKAETDSKNYTLNNYIERILKWHWFASFEVDWEEKTLKDFFESLSEKKDDWSFKVDDVEYNNLRNRILIQITDVWDRDLVSVYFDSIRNSQNTDLLEDNKIIINFDENNRKILQDLQQFDDIILWAMWIRDRDEWTDKKRRWINNPEQAIVEIISNWAPLAIIFGLIWKFFFWWHWKTWALAWLWLWNMSIAGIMSATWFAWDFLWDKEKKYKDKPIHRQFQNIFNDIPSNINKIKLQEYYEELLDNENFLNSPASNLNVFNNWTEEEKKAYFSLLWIDLNDENTRYYKYIFEKILKQREEDWIWEPKSWETMREYFERTQTGEEVVSWTWIATWEVVACAEVTWDWEIENESWVNETTEQEKTELLGYFNIDRTQISNLLNELQVLNLDLFKLLKWYKDFIETHLWWLESNILDKIKKSIWLKTWLIIWEINEFKNDDYYKTDFANNRWIINEKIKDIFWDINNVVLPSAFKLAKYSEDSSSFNEEQKEKIEWIKKKFSKNLKSDWDFDRTFWEDGWNLWRAGTDYWWDLTIDTTNEDDLELLKSLGYEPDSLQEISLLSERDQEIEDWAGYYYMGLLGIQIIAEFTPVWWWPWMFVEWANIFTNEHVQMNLATEMLTLKNPDYANYRMWKENWERWLSVVWLVPWAVILTKWTVVSKYISKLSPKKLEKMQKAFDEVIEAMWKKLWWDNSYLMKMKEWVKNRFFRWNTTENVTTWARTDFIVDSAWNTQDIRRSWNARQVDNTTTWARAVNAAESVSDGLNLWKRDIKILNNYIDSAVNSIIPWQTKTIWWIEIKNTWEVNRLWDYIFEYRNINWDLLKWTKSQLLSDNIIDINRVSDELRKTNNFTWLIRETNLHRIKNINWHKISFKDWNIEVLQWRKVLEWDELNNFVNENFIDILRAYWINWNKVSNPKIEAFKNNIHSFQQWVEKSNYSWKFSDGKMKALFSELTKPWRWIMQIIDSLVYASWKKDKTHDILKILVLWERSSEWLKLSSYKRLALSAWAAWTVVAFTDDELWPKEIIDVMLYNSLWLLWAIKDWYLD